MISKTLSIKLPHKGSNIHCCKDTGLVYVSSINGIMIYKGTELIHTIPSGPVMAFSPSGEYLVTNGGVYRTRGNFEKIKTLSATMTSAAFGASDDSFITISSGALVGYTWFSHQRELFWQRRYDIHRGENIRFIQRSGSRWVILNENGRLSYIAGDINWDPEDPVLFLDCLAPRELWTGNVRLIADETTATVVSDTIMWVRTLSNLKDDSKMFRVDDFEVGSVEHDRIVYRDSCHANGNIYRISRCGDFLLETIYSDPNPEPEPESEHESEPEPQPEREVKQVSKTGRVYGVTTRSRARAEAALKSLIKV